jgi:fructokinase
MTLSLGAVELGGAKVICAVGSGPHAVTARLRIPTTTPEETLAQATAFFAAYAPVAALGIAAFGPIRLDPAAPDYGRLIDTPKPGWSRFDLLGPFRAAGLGPLALDTDVNAAALAEARWGAGRLRGPMHAEFGHLRPAREAGDVFAGVCPFHGDCWEGLASGRAFAARWDADLSALPDEHPALDLHAAYVGRLCADVLLALSPHRVVVGGGGAAPRLLPRIRAAALQALAGYPPADRLAADAEIIISPAFDDSGLMGAFALAERAAVR